MTQEEKDRKKREKNISTSAETSTKIEKPQKKTATKSKKRLLPRLTEVEVDDSDTCMPD